MNLICTCPDYLDRWPRGDRTTLSELAQTAEASGVRTSSVMDHWFQMEAMWPADEPMLEGYTTPWLSSPRRTERLCVCLLVGGVTYRHPGLLAKHRSRRSTCSRADGPSSGWVRPGTNESTEASGCPSHPWPSDSNDWKRRSRSVCRCGAMTTGPTTAQFYHLAETLCSPSPAQFTASPNPHRRWRRKEDLASRGAVRRRVQHLR